MFSKDDLIVKHLSDTTTFMQLKKIDQLKKKKEKFLKMTTFIILTHFSVKLS